MVTYGFKRLPASGEEIDPADLEIIVSGLPHSQIFTGSFGPFSQEITSYNWQYFKLASLELLDLSSLVPEGGRGIAVYVPYFFGKIGSLDMTGGANYGRARIDLLVGEATSKTYPTSSAWELSSDNFWQSGSDYTPWAPVSNVGLANVEIPSWLYYIHPTLFLVLAGVYGEGKGPFTVTLDDISYELMLLAQTL